MLKTLLILVFIRPFISSLAFPYLNSLYSAFLIGFLIFWGIIKRPPLKKIQTLRYPLTIFCLALIISVVSSTDKLNSLKELYKYIAGLLLLIIAASLTYEDKMRFIRTIILTSLTIGLLAIYQYFFGFKHTIDYLAKDVSHSSFVLDYIQRRRAFFPFVTPNTLGGYLAMIIPLALVLGHKNIIWTILSFALLLTKSLGAFLSIFLALGIYFYLKGRLEKREIIFLFGLLVVTIGSVLIARITTQKQHLKPVFSLLMRLNYWKDTLEIIKTAPFWGVGLGNFNLAQSRYAHNSYLQIWAEMGILGIASLLWIIFKSFKIGFKKLKVAGSQKYIIASLLSANLTFLIHNLIDFSFFLPEVSMAWWIILGCTFGFN